MRRNSFLELPDALALFCYQNKESEFEGPIDWFYLDEITKIDEDTFNHRITVQHPIRSWMFHSNGDDVLHKKWVSGLRELCNNATLLKDGRGPGRISVKACESKAADELSFLRKLNGSTPPIDNENRQDNKQQQETAKSDIGSSKSNKQHMPNLTCPSSTTGNRVSSCSEDSSARKELAHLDIISSNGTDDISALLVTPRMMSEEGYHPRHHHIRSIDAGNRNFHDHAPANNRAKIVQVQDLPPCDDDDGIDDDIALDTLLGKLRDRDHRKQFLPIDQEKRPDVKLTSKTSREELMIPTKFVGHDESANKSLRNASEHDSGVFHRVPTVNDNGLLSIDSKTAPTPVNNGDNISATAVEKKSGLNKIGKKEREAANSKATGVDSLVDESDNSEDGGCSSDWSDWDEQRLNRRARPIHPRGSNAGRAMSVPVKETPSNSLRQTDFMKKYGLAIKDPRYEPDENFVDDDWDA